MSEERCVRPARRWWRCAPCCLLSARRVCRSGGARDLGCVLVHYQFERTEVDGAFELIAAHFT